MKTITSYDEQYRPQYHYTPEAGWINDPNGMVYFDGEYHLFYQHHPESTIWGPMHWGHAISKDLVRWEQHPIALYPDHNGTIFSGSAVVDLHDSSGFFGGGSGLVAMFTQDGKHPETGKSLQRQSLAYSCDKGRTWTMYAGNPVLADERFPDYRDPKVFWDESRGRWVMLLAAGDRVIIYHSPNLIDWTLGSEFGLEEGSHDGVWECPDLFELPVAGQPGVSRWVMLVSIGARPEHAEGSRTQYFVGEFDGEVFRNGNTSDTVLWLDHGRDNYAGVSWSDIPDQDGRRMYLGWMNNWVYANLIPTGAWRGAMTLPRVLELRSSDEGIRIFQTPVKELETIRRPLLRQEDVVITAGGANRLAGIRQNALEIEAELELGDAEAIGFRLFTADDRGAVVAYETGSRMLTLDRSQAGRSDFHELFACKHGAELEPLDGMIKLRIYVDQSSIEVFANDGRVVMTDLVFPEPEQRGIELFARGGSAKVRSLRVFELASIR